jgi:hypothetical protein
MRLMGLQRDYIYSFICEPGRVISPACIDDVDSGQTGPDVPPATEAVVRAFVLAKLGAQRSSVGGEFDEPASPWKIHQALVLCRENQTSLPFAESYQTEFKIIFSSDDDHAAKYMRAMSAFANAGGGYIFFGVSDRGASCSFESDRFEQFDWDRFDKLLQHRFAPYFRWDRRVCTLPDDEFLVGNDLKGLDSALVKRVALSRGVPAEWLGWLEGSDNSRRVPIAGVIYVWPSEVRIECRETYKKILREGVTYVRHRKRIASYERHEEIPSFARVAQTNKDRDLAQGVDDLERRISRKSGARQKAFEQSRLFDDD